MFDKLKIELIKEGDDKILIQKQGAFHAVIGFFMGIGLTLLFFVFASLIGLGSSWGNAAPELSANEMIVMVLSGLTLIFSGEWIRANIRYFTVIDRRKKRLFLRRRIWGWQLNDIELLSINQIERFALHTQDAVISVRVIYEFLFASWLNPLLGRKSKLELSEDSALIVLTNNGQRVYLSSFENGQEITDSIYRAANELNSWLNLSGQDYFKRPVSYIPTDKKNIGAEVAKWVCLVSFLIYICYLLVTV